MYLILVVFYTLCCKILFYCHSFKVIFGLINYYHVLVYMLGKYCFLISKYLQNECRTLKHISLKSFTLAY